MERKQGVVQTFVPTLILRNMNSLRNRVTLIGHLGQDPEMTTFDSGKVLTKMSMATSDSYKNAKGEKVEDTQWHDIKVWGKSGETAAKYLKKGSEVAVEGRINHSQFEDKEGNKRTKTEIIASEFVMLGGKARD